MPQFSTWVSILQGGVGQPGKGQEGPVLGRRGRQVIPNALHRVHTVAVCDATLCTLCTLCMVLSEYFCVGTLLEHHRSGR
jgi:hypothetical protein